MAVRAVVTVLITMLTVMGVLLVGGPVLEDIGSSVGQYDSINNGPMDGDGMIQGIYDAILIYMPLIVIGGIILFAVVYIFRRERVGRTGGGGGL